MHPVPHEGLTRSRLALGAFAFVVGEDEVGAPAVEVDRRTELSQGQRRALDVPSGTARAPHRLPGRLVGRARLPQHEVERVALVRVVHIAAPLPRVGEHPRFVVVAHRAEGREAADVEVHGAAGLVRVAAVEDHADEAADVGDGRRGPGLAEGLQDLERRHVLLEPAHLRRGQVEVVDPELAGLGQDGVVDIGDVADATNVVPEVDQPSLQHVVLEVDGGVAEVGRVVGRDAARVHRHQPARLEGHHVLAGRVVEPHHVSA